jgi:2-amino-4-hydroxy-6-hydroxymethyldihydropteridine diphosphokinase
MWTTAYLSLGSNLGDRVRNIDEALRLLQDADLVVLRRSALYETEPRDYSDQPWFLNLVAEVRTTLSPEALLARICLVESHLGRQRTLDKGPRTADVDILTFGDLVLETTNLQIPHPRMRERRFVLEPLAELVPGRRMPGDEKTIDELLGTVKDQKVRQITSNG